MIKKRMIRNPVSGKKQYIGEDREGLKLPNFLQFAP